MRVVPEDIAMAAPAKMEIFRAATAPLFDERAARSFIPPAAIEPLTRLSKAGRGDGYVLKTLFEAPGFALHYVWFKPNYQLSRHSHDRDALYYIVAGSIRLGSECLGAGDGIFLPADTPYIYTVGPEGVEILEFRHDADFSTDVRAGSQAYWDRMLASVETNRAAWLAAEPPPAAKVG
jgi:quercetin dioxygenase-like cupin family protein